MSGNHETPEERRERMRQEELKKPSSSIQGSNLADLVGGLEWKGTGILVLLLIGGFLIYSVFFR
ncbi:DUF6366 family protein [Virgibacillus sediminis]|uniref:DUF6366 family protein n=1 Tax=Virgibacillus sediminis TaxID=202260 RepID=A0ABV7A882_9BACI